MVIGIWYASEVLRIGFEGESQCRSRVRNLWRLIKRGDLGLFIDIFYEEQFTNQCFHTDALHDVQRPLEGVSGHILSS